MNVSHVSKNLDHPEMTDSNLNWGIFFSSFYFSSYQNSPKLKWYGVSCHKTEHCMISMIVKNSAKYNDICLPLATLELRSLVHTVNAIVTQEVAVVVKTHYG